MLSFVLCECGDRSISSLMEAWSRISAKLPKMISRVIIAIRKTCEVLINCLSAEIAIRDAAARIAEETVGNTLKITYGFLAFEM